MTDVPAEVICVAVIQLAFYVFLCNCQQAILCSRIYWIQRLSKKFLLGFTSGSTQLTGIAPFDAIPVSQFVGIAAHRRLAAVDKKHPA